MNATVREMVRAYLDGMGFDGLYSADAECGCKLDDLAPCGEMSPECAAGYLHPVGCPCEICADGEDTWHICGEPFKAKKTNVALALFKELWKTTHGKPPSAAAVQVARRTFERLAAEGIQHGK